MIAPKLKPGDEVRIIAPSRSFKIIPNDQREISVQRFKEMGLKISFGQHIEESGSAVVITKEKDGKIHH